MGFVKRTARLVGWAGLTSVGVLHAMWGAGSSWPAKNRKQLGKAVVGSAKAMPSAEAAWVVSGAAFSGAAVVAGGLGEGRVAVGLRRVIGLLLLVRGAAGGEAALRTLGLPEGGKRFNELDRRFYRPFCSTLGIAVLIGARRS
ncbi:DUF3995 domain-containing protein [Leucobacter sp. GX24907]